MIRVQTIDNFLPDPEAYRAKALAEEFKEVKGPDGFSYKGVAPQPENAFANILSEKLGRPVKVDYAFHRLSYREDVPDSAIHCDSDYSPFAFVLFLNPTQQAIGGTAFWRHKRTLLSELPSKETLPDEIYAELYRDRADMSKWEKLHVAKMKFNRAVLFPTQQFHSRWPFSGFGNAKDGGRLVAVGFFRS